MGRPRNLKTLPRTGKTDRHTDCGHPRAAEGYVCVEDMDHQSRDDIQDIKGASKDYMDKVQDRQRLERTLKEYEMHLVARLKEAPERLRVPTTVRDKYRYLESRYTKVDLSVRSLLEWARRSEE